MNPLPEATGTDSDFCKVGSGNAAFLAHSAVPGMKNVVNDPHRDLRKFEYLTPAVLCPARQRSSTVGAMRAGMKHFLCQCFPMQHERLRTRLASGLLGRRRDIGFDPTGQVGFEERRRTASVFEALDFLAQGKKFLLQKQSEVCLLLHQRKEFFART